MPGHELPSDVCGNSVGVLESFRRPLYRVFHRGEPWPRGCFQGRFLGYVLFCSDFGLRSKHILTPKTPPRTHAVADDPQFHDRLCVERKTRWTPQTSRLFDFTRRSVLFHIFTLGDVTQSEIAPGADGTLEPWFSLLATLMFRQPFHWSPFPAMGAPGKRFVALSGIIMHSFVLSVLNNFASIHFVASVA